MINIILSFLMAVFLYPFSKQIDIDAVKGKCTYSRSLFSGAFFAFTVLSVMMVFQ